MPALIPTDHYATITFLGLVRDRKAGLVSHPVDQIAASFAGPVGEDHGGLTRPSCSRVVAQYPKGTTIRNTRQFSVLSAEELDQIAARMGLDRLDPALLGATMVLAGLPDFSNLPPSSRLQGEGGATLVADMQNRPCQLPARPIEGANPGFGARFRSAANGRRGITAWVEREGTFRLGERVRLHIPDQPVWAGARG
ncbi:MAG: hypothetical protein RIR62_1003 [Pseudomonadota bacterium]|jgi:hypothetical protein